MKGILNPLEPEKALNQRKDQTRGLPIDFLGLRKRICLFEASSTSMPTSMSTEMPIDTGPGPTSKERATYGTADWRP